MANIGRKSGVDAQGLRHFISDSPWEAGAMLDMMREAGAQRGKLRAADIEYCADIKGGSRRQG